MSLTRILVLCLAVLLTATLCFTQNPNTPATAGPQQATHLLGLEAVKRDVKGKLVIGSEGVKFSSAAGNAQIPTASIEDVFTGQDSRQTGGKAMTVTKMAVPYGGGRVLSLFAHEKFDSLTIEYRDSDSGLHAAIFRLRQGQAAAAKKQLIAMGAKASTPAEEIPAGETKDAAKKEKQ